MTMASSPSNMCKEMNAPVLPESKKVNATVINSIILTGEYSFVFDAEFTEAIQMNQRDHACLCRPSDPMTHFCCPGCLERRYLPFGKDWSDLQRVLGGYKFYEYDPVLVVDQMLDLMIRNFPLALYSYGKGHQAVTNKLGIATLFFADIDSVHRFAGHVIHACEDYYYHEEYLHTVYHGAMYDLDWSPIHEAHKLFGGLQVTKNRLHDRLMMSYLGGGVGTGYVEPRTQEMARFLEQDCGMDAPRSVCGVYLAAGNGGPLGVYKAVRSLLIPHEPIAGEVVKWSPEWIDDGFDNDGDT